MAVLALDAHLLGVRVPLRAAQGGGVPAGLQLPGQRVRGLPALQLGRADPGVTPALGEAALGRARVLQLLVAQVGRRRLVGGRRRQVQEFTQRLQRLALGGEGHRRRFLLKGT